MFFGNFTQVEEQFELSAQRGNAMDPTNAIARFEVAGKALGEARHRNREEGFAIIVEGPRDKVALQRLGFEGPIEVGGWIGLWHICTKPTGREPKIAVQP